MGGSGGGGGTRWPNPPEDSCDLRIDTHIFGPVPTVAQTLRVGDLLGIRLAPSGNSSTVAIFTQGPNTTQVGTVVGPPRLASLIRCLQQGVLYEASVTAVSGPQISIRIERI